MKLRTTISKYHSFILLPAKDFVIFTCRYFKLSWNTTALSQSDYRNFSCSSINAIILVILFDNLIDGMIIAVVIATEKQFQINYQNCNDHICILIFVFPQFKSSSSLVSPYGPCTFLMSCSRSLFRSVVQSKCILPYVFYPGRIGRTFL